MATHPMSTLEEKLRRSQALARAAVNEFNTLRLPEAWAVGELLGMIEETLAEGYDALTLAVKASARRAA